MEALIKSMHKFPDKEEGQALHMTAYGLEISTPAIH